MLVAHPYDFSLMIRSRRLQLKLTQAELAKEMGVGRQWIIDLEGGKPTVEFAGVCKAMATLDIGISLAMFRDPPAWTVPLTAAATERENRVKILHMARTGERKPTTYRRAKRPAPKGWGRWGIKDIS